MTGLEKIKPSPASINRELTSERSSPFEKFFSNPVYLLYKNHLYNYLARRFSVRKSLETHSPGKNAWILELGSGVSPLLNAGSRTIRSDISWQALVWLKTQESQQGPSPSVASNATALPFANESIQTVICSEVLEHIQDDEAVLREIGRVLCPGGELLLTCPMRPELFGFDDSFVGHFRRYEKDKLIGRLRQKGLAGFHIEPVLGSLEKILMVALTRFLSFFPAGKGENPGNSSPGAVRVIILALLPFYLFINYLLAFVVYQQARFGSLEKAVCLLIRCQKSL